MLFAGLSQVRAASLALLIGAIKGGTDTAPTLPPFTLIGRPRTLFHALWLFARLFLLDRDLPVQWRFFMWWWFSARYLASSMMKRPQPPRAG